MLFPLHYFFTVPTKVKITEKNTKKTIDAVGFRNQIELPNGLTVTCDCAHFVDNFVVEVVRS